MKYTLIVLLIIQSLLAFDATNIPHLHASMNQSKRIFRLHSGIKFN